MNQTEYIEALNQIPEETRKQYGLLYPPDYSNDKCIHTNEYDYYPELNCCIINERTIVWESGNPWVTPENPMILEGFKRRITDNTPRLKLIEQNYDGTISCYSPAKCELHISNMQRKNQTTYLILDNEKTYYNPNEIDLPNRPDLLQLIPCLFYAHTHEYIGLIPDKNTSPEEWWPVEFVTETEFKKLKKHK